MRAGSLELCLAMALVLGGSVWMVHRLPVAHVVSMSVWFAFCSSASLLLCSCMVCEYFSLLVCWTAAFWLYGSWYCTLYETVTLDLLLALRRISARGR